MFVLELQTDANMWTPIAYCFSRKQAKDTAALVLVGKSWRVREFGKAAQ